MDAPLGMTFLVLRRSWDSPLMLVEYLPGAVYTEFREEYVGRFSGGEPSLADAYTVELTDKSGTGRRFELVDVLEEHEFVRLGDEGHHVVVHPADRRVFRLKEI